MESKTVRALGQKYIPNFIGVYNIDNIKIPNKLPAGYIVNVLSKKTPSHVIGHWVGIVITNNEVYLLDSEGKYALKKYCLKKFLNRIGKPIRTNFFRIQHKNSTSCGIYALVFLYHMLVLRKSFKSFLTLIMKKPSNENLICKMFKSYFKYKCDDVKVDI